MTLVDFSSSVTGESLVSGADVFNDSRSQEKTPVLFLHGNSRTPIDWAPYFHYFYHNGYVGNELWAINFTGESHEQLADEINGAVEVIQSETACEGIDFVGHSLGVTAGRYWIHTQNKYDFVRRFVSIAGANNGVAALEKVAEETKFTFTDTFAQELQPNSNVIQEINDGYKNHLGEIEYYTISGEYDALFMFDPDSPHLPNARTLRLPVGHNTVRTHHVTIQTTFNFCNYG